MHCPTMAIPSLNFPHDEIIEIVPAAYQNEAKRVHIPGLESTTNPSSPDMGLQTAESSMPPSGPASGQMSPIPPGLSSPIEAPPGRRPSKVINTAKDMVADKVDDED